MALQSVSTSAVNGVSTRASQAAAVPTWVFKPVPNDTQANRLSNQAVDLLKQGNPAAAVGLLEKALGLPREQGTDYSAALNRLGVAWNRLENQGEAMKNFSAALVAAEKAGTTAPNANYNRGVSFLKTAIEQSGQWEAFKTDKGSVNAAALDPQSITWALDDLETAVKANGPFFTKMTLEDTDWAPLVNEPRFRSLVGLPSLVAKGPTDQLAQPVAAPPPQDAQRAAASQQWHGANQKSVGYGD